MNKDKTIFLNIFIQYNYTINLCSKMGAIHFVVLHQMALPRDFIWTFIYLYP